MTFVMEIKVTSLTQEDISNILSNALYGNWWVWSKNTIEAYKQVRGKYIEDKLACIIFNGGVIDIIDTEDNDKSYSINLHTFKQGLNKYMTESGNIDIDEWDLNDADCALQYMCFGKVIYG